MSKVKKFQNKEGFSINGKCDLSANIFEAKELIFEVTIAFVFYKDNLVKTLYWSEWQTFFIKSDQKYEEKD